MLRNNKNLFIIKVLCVLIVVLCLLFLFFGIKKGNFEYALSQRLPKLIAIIITASLIGFSTVLFQTITDNRILTPNVMGLDSFYVLIQTIIVFIFGAEHFLITNSRLNFLLCAISMVLVSTILYSSIFKKGKSNIILVILVGMIMGTLFSSLSRFMQIVIDPNEYLTLQNKLFASFNNINTDILAISILVILIVFVYIFRDVKYLDVMSLGRDHAVNLGVDYDKLTKKFFVAIAVLISISTALVGPITFLGLLVVNLTKQVTKTYKHSYLIFTCILISIFTLVFGQFLLERVLKIQTPVSVIINLIGGMYFMYLLLRESKIC